MRTEYLGVFGLTWQEKLASDLYNLYNDKSLKLSALSSITHGSGWNIAYINQMESAFKQGYQIGYRGDSLANYMKTLVQFDNPNMANSYVQLRPTVSGGNIENVITGLTSPIGKGVGNVVGSVTAPLTKPLALIAIIAVAGFIVYSQISKSTIKKAVHNEP